MPIHLIIVLFQLVQYPVSMCLLTLPNIVVVILVIQDIDSVFKLNIAKLISGISYEKS